MYCSILHSSINFRSILEYEMERLSLKQKIFELNFSIEDQELFFNAQVDCYSTPPPFPPRPFFICCLYFRIVLYLP
jgi:hypothetical protein